MAVYCIWNNKGGVGKSYLTFRIACEYARTHPNEHVLVIDLCPQADASSMLLGGMVGGEQRLSQLGQADPRLTIAGYVRERISSPYQNPRVGATYALNVGAYNPSGRTSKPWLQRSSEACLIEASATQKYSRRT